MRDRSQHGTIHDWAVPPLKNTKPERKATVTLSEFFERIYPLLLDRTVEKVEKQLGTGETVTAYWAGTIIRIDIKPS